MILPRSLSLVSAVLALAGAPALAGEPKEAATRHWSLAPRAHPVIPRATTPEDHHWIRNPIDAFILARLRREGLKPAPPADRRTLIRRLFFDLTGLPPAPEEVDAFVRDPAPDAEERLVDRLLASPRYGERWGRHWLDVVRYAETEGFEYDRERPGAWRYRDRVIASFNGDQPYDRFITEQLAGDEIAPTNRDVLAAAGFHRLGPVRRNAGNPELVFSRHEVLSEMTDAVGVVFLGLTVGCARCHDHKFDDFSLADYYRLQAFLAATVEHDVILAGASEQARWKRLHDRVARQQEQLRKSLPNLTGAALVRAEKTIAALECKLPPVLPTISTVRHAESQRTPIHVLKRGNTENKGRKVGPRLAGLFTGGKTIELPADAPAPRTALARSVASADNPLTARVMVNRIWQYHFGRGLVETSNDFGANGSLPSHPELLDWLANEFIRGGWRIKPLHRLIVSSSTYRQSAQHPDARAGMVKDSRHRFLWRFPKRRLGAEEVRDAMLSVAGRLNTTMGGAGVVVPVESDLVKLLYAPSQWAVTPAAREHERRSVYLIVKRNLRLPFLETFDVPDAQTSCARRESSTHALQALEMLNGKLSNTLAEAFLRRVQHEAGPDRGRQIDRAFLLTAGRLPGPKEKALCLRFLERQPAKEFALAVLNLNAFLYVE
jgi:hypothetical protein